MRKKTCIHFLLLVIPIAAMAKSPLKESRTDDFPNFGVSYLTISSIDKTSAPSLQNNNSNKGSKGHLLNFEPNKDPEPKKQTAISIGYLGEMVTHPGIKIGLSYTLLDWNKTKKEKTIVKSISLNPSIGTYYHRRYQTGVFILPELAINKVNEKGNGLSYGVGAGYLRTFIPNAFSVNDNNVVKKENVGYNYFLGSTFISFEKNLKFSTRKPLKLYIKPQFMYALPNFPKGVGYLMMEVGLKYTIL
ncbi:MULTISPECIES: hypothetical protein [Flavobacteriaceae]|uniref:hypothetical protein n=1 Tax=Flavobacteriaceae TaxID=49546 RepID=UPI001490ED70|nr:MULTISPECIES: hypothetical protein [Allomuricauda]MDC6366836.1 hypothetical protein [Muricauda sp. AC10]